MKANPSNHLSLRAAIVMAIAAAPAWSLASAASPSSIALAGISTVEVPRVTQTVDPQATSIVAQTHLAFLSKLQLAGNVPDTTKMSHIQLILQPSAQRTAALQNLVAEQHDPSSTHFHQWLTPQQYGQAFGITDSDLAAITSWLTSQGFTVNSIYPNKTEIDFSGSVGQVRQAFRTQLQRFVINGKTHIANTSDISVPAALKPVITGVMGLNDMRPQPQHVAVKVAAWNKNTHKFNLLHTEGAKSPSHSMALSFTDNERGLVPNDFAKMYGVMPIRQNGVVGKGITIAVVEGNSMVPGDWTNFINQFNLSSWGGTFTQIQPQLADGTINCSDPNAVYGPGQDDTETTLDAEYASAMAPGAHIVVASCADYTDNTGSTLATDNFFGGVFVAATNLINANSGRPDIISASYGFGENFVDSASKRAIDLMWAQADAEGISVFVSSGDSGTNPSFNGTVISGTGVDANAFATSPNVTAVGGTDTADVLDGTTNQYFSKTINIAYGSALGYVPEIPWNESCGNGVAAKVSGYSSAVDFCNSLLKYDPEGETVTSEAASGGPSHVDTKPAWQRLVTGATPDQSRDVPDISLFAGSYGGYTWAVMCTAAYPCTPDFSTPVSLIGGTSLAAPMFAGIQALIDQGLAMRGLPADQGNAAPTLYALAGKEYGTGMDTPPASLAACSADNGSNGTESCVFHDITRGSISTECFEEIPFATTSNCYFFTTVLQGMQIGLTTKDAMPTQYSPQNKAYSAQPGWNFATGLGSVNTENLLIAWRAFVHAPVAAPAP